MDALLIFLASIVALSLSYIFYVKFLPRNPKTEELRRQDRGQERPRPRENVPRRAQLARNRGARLRVHAGPQDAAPPSDDENDPQQQNRDPIEADLLEGKMGAKKRAKLEARAEKKAMREAEEQSRADKRKKEQLAEEERKKLALKEEQDRKQREEEERKAREEQERKEHEEYLKMKEAFSIEEEGYEEDSESNETNLLQEFVNYIKNNKVVLIEDLAAHFKLKTQATIDRIKDLQKDDILSGVIDDRGKFIYISAEEMEAVAKFIRQRGRVSITELAENSNKLINLTPVVAK